MYFNHIGRVKLQHHDVTMNNQEEEMKLVLG